MAAIKVQNYQTLAQAYADAQKQVSGVTTFYYDAAYEVVILQAFDPEIDLLQPFYQAYLSAQVSFDQAPSSVIAAVGALQRHVLDKARTNAGGKFSDINEWLKAEINGSPVGRQGDSDAAIKVPQEFANLSFQAGFAILSENIDPNL